MNLISLGTHYLAEFYDCDKAIISSKVLIKEAMLEAARVAKSNIVTDVFHEFNPYGVSGVVVIAESHIAIHSWPEYCCASIDIFTCSENMEPSAALAYLEKAFKAKKVEVRIVKRGQVPN